MHSDLTRVNRKLSVHEWFVHGLQLTNRGGGHSLVSSIGDAGKMQRKEKAMYYYHSINADALSPGVIIPNPIYGTCQQL
jgi:hypothetical protein